MDVITLSANTEVYKSISEPYKRSSVFNYKLFNMQDSKCNTISWFALSQSKAEYYKNKSTSASVYTYYLTKNIQLFVTNSKNNLGYLFSLINENSDLKVLYDAPLRFLPAKIRSRFSHYEYMQMDVKNRAIHEYMFAFGLLTVQQQHNFMKLVLKLQEYQVIPILKKMHGINMFKGDISYVLRLARNWLNVKQIHDKNMIGQRFSLYNVDINVAYNLCSVLPADINGYVYFHQASVWHPKMIDTSEMALFDINNLLR